MVLESSARSRFLGMAAYTSTRCGNQRQVCTLVAWRTDCDRKPHEIALPELVRGAQRAVGVAVRVEVEAADRSGALAGALQSRDDVLPERRSAGLLDGSEQQIGRGVSVGGEIARTMAEARRECRGEGRIGERSRVEEARGGVNAFGGGAGRGGEEERHAKVDVERAVAMAE